MNRMKELSGSRASSLGHTGSRGQVLEGCGGVRAVPVTAGATGVPKKEVETGSLSRFLAHERSFTRSAKHTRLRIHDSKIPGILHAANASNFINMARCFCLSDVQNKSQCVLVPQSLAVDLLSTADPGIVKTQRFFLGGTCKKGFLREIAALLGCLVTCTDPHFRQLRAMSDEPAQNIDRFDGAKRAFPSSQGSCSFPVNGVRSVPQRSPNSFSVAGRTGQRTSLRRRSRCESGFGEQE